jgi:hypothetical protein
MSSSQSAVAAPGTYQVTDLEFRSYRVGADGSSAQATTLVGDWGYQALTASATTVVKTGAGQLNAVLVATATGNLTLYDNTAASGTVILNASAMLVGSLVFNVAFSVGLTAVLSGAGVATAIYR